MEMPILLICKGFQFVYALQLTNRKSAKRAYLDNAIFDNV